MHGATLLVGVELLTQWLPWLSRSALSQYISSKVLVALQCMYIQRTFAILYDPGLPWQKLVASKSTRSIVSELLSILGHGFNIAWSFQFSHDQVQENACGLHF